MINSGLLMVLVTNHVRGISSVTYLLVRGTVSKPFARSKFFHAVEKTVVTAERS